MFSFFHRIRLLLGVFFLLIGGFPGSWHLAHAQVFRARWAQQLGGPEIDQTVAVTVDAQHNSYVTGLVRGQAQIGPAPVGSRAVTVYTAKYDANGTLAWVRTAAAPPSYSRGQALAVDGAGNVYVAGTFTDTLAFGGTTLYGTVPPGFFIRQGFMAKYNAQGDLQWVRQLSRYYDCNALALDGSGNVYLAGNGTAVLSKFTPQGQLLWEQTTNPQLGGLVCTGLTVDANNRVWVAGSCSGQVQLNGAPPRSTIGTIDAVLACFDAQGTLLSWRQLGQRGRTEALGVAVAADGSVYFHGRLDGTATFGSTTLTAQTSGSLYVASFDAAGNPRWAQPIHSPSGAYFATSLVLDATGAVCVAGAFHGATVFGSTTLTATSGAALFIGRYSAQGSLLSVQQAGVLNSNSTAQDLAIGPDDDLYICGFLLHNATLGGQPLTSRGEADGFVARFSTRPLGTRGATSPPLFSAYPNPATTGRLHVALARPGSGPAGQLRLLNALGQVVSTQAVAAGSTRADLSTAGLARGRYALQLISGEAVSTQAVIIP